MGLKGLLHTMKLSRFRARRDVFLDDLARALENNEALRDFLREEIKTSAAKRTSNPSRLYALKCIRARLERGEDLLLSALLMPAFPPEDRLMLAALDTAQSKVDALKAMAETLRFRNSLIAMMRNKFIMPSVVVVGVFLYVYTIANGLIFELGKIAPPEVWTGFNGLVRGFSQAVSAYAPVAVGALVVLVTWFIWALPRWHGRWRLKLEGMKPATATMLFPVCPVLLPLSMYREYQAGMLLSSLSFMLQAGKVLNEALILCARSATPWMREHIRAVLRHLEHRPTQYTQAFSKGLMSPELLARLASQVRNNPHFDQVLIELGTAGKDTLRAEIDKRSTTLSVAMYLSALSCAAFVMVGSQSIGLKFQEEMSPTKIMAREVKRRLQMNESRGAPVKAAAAAGR